MEPLLGIQTKEYTLSRAIDNATSAIFDGPFHDRSIACTGVHDRDFRRIFVCTHGENHFPVQPIGPLFQKIRLLISAKPFLACMLS
jgi:hypothetical protein